MPRRGTENKIEKPKNRNAQGFKNQRKTPWHLQTKLPEDTSSRHLWLVNKGERTSTSPLALGYPLLGPSRRVWASLAFSAAIHFVMKLSTPRSVVLRHSPSSWIAVVHWSALMPKALRSSRKHPIHPYFFLAPRTARAPHQFAEHHALRQSRILHARHRSRKQDPPPA